MTISDDPLDPDREAAGAPRDPDRGPDADPELEGELDAEEWERIRAERRRRRERHDRKERVLHTRISGQLSDDIRSVAEDLRVPASNLVRNVLEEAFGAVERVSEEVGDLIDEVLGEAEGAREDLRRYADRYQRYRERARRRRAAPHASSPSSEPARAARPAEAPPAREAPPAPGAPAPPHRGPRAGAYMTFPDVIGWQPLLANADGPCACGERELRAGDETFAAVTAQGISRTLLCADCMRQRGSR